MVKLKQGNKTYMLNRQEFMRYMKILWKKAQAKKAAREDFEKEMGAGEETA